MSAEPVDPFASIQGYADMDEVEEIRAAFYNRPWEDPTRFQDGFRILLGAVVAITEGSAADPRARATQALRRVMRRVVIGEDQAEVDRHE